MLLEAEGSRLVPLGETSEHKHGVGRRRLLTIFLRFALSSSTILPTVTARKQDLQESKALWAFLGAFSVSRGSEIRSEHAHASERVFLT